MLFNLDILEDALKLLKEPQEASPCVVSKSYYEKGIELFGKEEMDKALKQYNAIVFKGI